MLTMNEARIIADKRVKERNLVMKDAMIRAVARHMLIDITIKNMNEDRAADDSIDFVLKNIMEDGNRE